LVKRHACSPAVHHTLSLDVDHLLVCTPLMLDITISYHLQLIEE